MGRPTDYCDKIAIDICTEISLGRSLRSICEDQAMPSVRTVITWKRKYPEFLQQYDSACIERSEMLVEDMLHIADNSDPSEAAKTRIQVDTRKWAASKMKPKKYGENSEPEKQVVPFIVNTIDD
jgi:hypothetical protein